MRWVAIAVIVVGAILPALLPGYFLYVLTLGMIWAVAAVGLNILTGFTGQISIGHAGFMAVGAYASALLGLRLHWPVWLTLPAAAVLAGAVGWLVGLPALRLTGPYLAIATLGFGTSVTQVLVKWTSLTGGHMGLKPPRPALGAWVVSGDAGLYYLTAAVLLTAGVVAARVLRSAVGRAFVALRDSEAAAQACGISLVRYKTLAFAISAAYAGVAGALYAHVVGFISPFDFNLVISIFLVSAIVIGGLASIPGSVAGAVALTVGFHLLGDVRDLRTVLYGLVLILTVIFFPGGLWRGLPRREAARVSSGLSARGVRGADRGAS